MRYRFLQFELDTGARELRLQARAIPLQRRAFDVLLYLLVNRDRAITRAELIEQLWPTEHVTDGVVAQCVLKLRAALDDRDSSIILTVHRIGYRFTPVVETVADLATKPESTVVAVDAAAPATALPEPASATVAAAAAPPSASTRRGRSWAYPALGSVLLAVAVYVIAAANRTDVSVALPQCLEVRPGQLNVESWIGEFVVDEIRSLSMRDAGGPRCAEFLFDLARSDESFVLRGRWQGQPLVISAANPALLIQQMRREFAGLGLRSPEVDSQSANQLLADAGIEYDAFKYDAAIALLRQALAKDPGNLVARQLLARAYLNAGQSLPAAMHAYLALQSAPPGSGVALRAALIYHFGTGAWDDGLRYFEAVPREQCEQIVCRIALGVMLSGVASYQDALQYLRDIDPQDLSMDLVLMHSQARIAALAAVGELNTASADWLEPAESLAPSAARRRYLMLLMSAEWLAEAGRSRDAKRLYLAAADHAQAAGEATIAEVCRYLATSLVRLAAAPMTDIGTLTARIAESGDHLMVLRVRSSEMRMTRASRNADERAKFSLALANDAADAGDRLTEYRALEELHAAAMDLRNLDLATHAMQRLARAAGQSPVYGIGALAMRFGLEWKQGQIDAAKATAAQLHSLAEQVPQVPFRYSWACGLGELHVALNELDEASAAYELCIRSGREAGDQSLQQYGLAGQSIVASLAGDKALARAKAKSALAQNDHGLWGSRAKTAAALTMLGETRQVENLAGSPRWSQFPAVLREYLEMIDALELVVARPGMETSKALWRFAANGHTPELRVFTLRLIEWAVPTQCHDVALARAKILHPLPPVNVDCAPHLVETPR